MNDSLKLVTEGLLKAMKAEHDGHYFYLSAAKNTEDPQGKSVFEMLADEEREHMEFLRAQYASYMETGHADTTVSLRMKKQLTGESPIFSSAIKKNIKQAHYEMSALSIGIMLEQNSVSFYEAQARAVDDAEARDLYTQLADWERGHLHALIQQENALKVDYWREAGFEPF
ncbi:ferritin family protein [Candidatus Fermentibacteria bacterium]|nr:ferritin family protein [Candidatus Fermentibacteria bacterium]